MEFIHTYESGGYSTSYHADRIPFARYLELVSDIVSKPGCTVCPVVERKQTWFLRHFRSWRYYHDVYIMVLDCDGTDEMLAACNTLKHDNINYALVQSSPSHYWVITDYLASLSQIVAKMRSIPGVDEKFVDYVVKMLELQIRGVATPGHIPIFGDYSALKNEHSRKFYQDLQELYSHPVILRRLHTEVLQQAVGNKAMADVAANPEFQL